MADTQEQTMESLLADAQTAYSEAADQTKFADKRLPTTIPDATYNGDVYEISSFVTKKDSCPVIKLAIRFTDTDPAINNVEFEDVYFLNETSIWKFKQLVRTLNHGEAIGDVTEAVNFVLGLNGPIIPITFDIFTSNSGYQNTKITSRDS